MVPAKVSRNLLLPFQVDSQLRRRVVQELELLIGLPAEERPKPLLACSAEQTASILGTKGGSLGMPAPEEKPPAACLLLHGSVPTDSQPDGAKAYSRLFALRASGLAASDSALAAHRIPLYSIAALFDILRTKKANAGAEAASSVQSVQPTQRKKQASPARTLEDLAATHPAIYEREIAALESMHATVRGALLQLGAGELDKLVFVPAGQRRWTPLLISLWRWRMWVGEGWSGDGFGVLEATGRRKPPLV